MLLGGGPNSAFGLWVCKFTGKLQQHGGSTDILKAGDFSATRHAINSRSDIPAGLGDAPFLWCKIPGRRDDPEGSVSNVGISNRVEIQIQTNGLIRIPSHIVVAGVVPPLFKRAVMVGAEDLIRESQTETRARQSVGPDLRVFTMTTHLAVVPLLGQIGGNFGMAPFKGVGAVSDHLKRAVPLVIAGHVSMQAEQKRKKPFKEQHPIGRDWVGLDPIRRNAIGRPARHIVVAPFGLWDQGFIPVGVS